MNLIKLITILSISIFTLHLFNLNYRKGLSSAVFLLVLMPRELYIEIGGDLPTLTGFRAIMLVVIFCSFYNRKLEIKLPKLLIINILILIFVAKIISLIFSFNFSLSLNGLLIFLIERFLFFVILIKSIADRETMNSIFNSMFLAIIVIAIVGLIEKYTQFNIVDYITPYDSPRLEPRMAREVYSTLPHPILFGTALAMGWPICLSMIDRQSNLVKKNILWLCLLIMVAGIYFSNSRGPWLGFILATLVLFVFNYPYMKIRAIPILYLTILILILRPGVYNTISGLSSSTFDENSLEGGSFLYRFELFKVAYYEIIKFPERLAFGYGDEAAQSMNIRGTISYGSGAEVNFWSWDSELAVILLQGGFIGFILHLILYFSILFYLIRGFELLEDRDKNLLIALIASTSVLIFMMTNVAIFAPQLRFIMWTNVAIGVFLIQNNSLNNTKKFINDKNN